MMLSGTVRQNELETGRVVSQPLPNDKTLPIPVLKNQPRESSDLAVMLYVRFPLSLRNVEDLLHERGIEISHETVRFWWNRFGPMFAAEIRRNRGQ